MMRILTCFLKSNLTKGKKSTGKKLKQLASNEDLVKHKKDRVILETNGFVFHHTNQDVEKLFIFICAIFSRQNGET